MLLPSLTISMPRLHLQIERCILVIAWLTLLLPTLPFVPRVTQRSPYLTVIYCSLVGIISSISIGLENSVILTVS